MVGVFRKNGGCFGESFGCEMHLISVPLNLIDCRKSSFSKFLHWLVEFVEAILVEVF